jgi:hypothetical protein
MYFNVIHKYTWTSPDRKTHHKIDHIAGSSLRSQIGSQVCIAWMEIPHPGLIHATGCKHPRYKLEDLDAEVDIKSAWEMIRDIIKTADKESLVR